MHTNNSSRVKICLSVFLVCFICLQISFVNGHDPSLMTLDYDFTTQTLEVYIEHLISPEENETHYINKILIYKNITLAQEHDYTSQSSSFLTFYYIIGASHLEYIKVAAYCSMGGNINRSLIVIDPDYTFASNITSATLDSFQLLPTSLTLFCITFMSFIIQTIKRKKR
ncbi:MAG TPA: hypothetical protein VMX55_01035 [candidate division Zixibacteria bacterium]|nr:hypothetical protein [candidate division Zixibacteria bacterium]